ncbi:putative baseplate assembly protein [Phormidesmis sp. 146-12]
METFDFLPQLPKSNLDDRTFQDLVDECIVRIPHYCPEWTNYNPSDPGVTLIELFAWLTDQMLVRFNQIPRRNYITFLELLGIRLQPPKSAQVDVTFYLSAAQTEFNRLPAIPAGTEVATVRTDTEDAIVFSTDQELAIGCPKIKHFLTAENAADPAGTLRDGFDQTGWRRTDLGAWENVVASPLFPGVQVDSPNGNVPHTMLLPIVESCFYLVLREDEPLAGNVIVLTFRGEVAQSTGIIPQNPPRQWEAWDGEKWVPVLLKETDDQTEGFSFHNASKVEGTISSSGPQGVAEADIILHTPPRWMVTESPKAETPYKGYWLRCVHIAPRSGQFVYHRSPRIVGISARSIGGTIGTSQSVLVEDEILGISDGNAGQTFQLQRTPVLPRSSSEHIQVRLPTGERQTWEEVQDFGNSSADSFHYTVDAITGIVQFGPLIREPAQLQQQTKSYIEKLQEQFQRDQLQQRQDTMQINGALKDPIRRSDLRPKLDRQYGCIPVKGAEILMTYRTGGGRKGNVAAGTITILKSAFPYVASVNNATIARNGTDAESIDEAVIKVPKTLRTRDRAVTKEDFETLTLEAGGGAIAHVRAMSIKPGMMHLLIVPWVDPDAIAQGKGKPDLYIPDDKLKERVKDYLHDRLMPGIGIEFIDPTYVGITVETEVALEREYYKDQEKIRDRLKRILYEFLNPIVGGTHGKGWTFGRPVYASDIVRLLQKEPGIRYVNEVQLFELHRKQDGSWASTVPTHKSFVNPGDGLIFSWSDAKLQSDHYISTIEAE